MRHSDLPTWLKPALSATRHGHAVEYDDNDIRVMVEAQHTISTIEGLRCRVRASIPGRCWSCGGTWQEGTQFGREGNIGSLVGTVRHVRRGNCSYHEYSDRFDYESGESRLGSRNPAVQLSQYCWVTLRIFTERSSAPNREEVQLAASAGVDESHPPTAPLIQGVEVTVDTTATVVIADPSTPEPDLRRVPVLEDASFLGMETIDGTACLVFRSDKHGQIQVWVHARHGGELLFSYKQWDDRLGGTEVVYEGPSGDPTLDTPVLDDDG